jgi:hypothetical protein
MSPTTTTPTSSSKDAALRAELERAVAHAAHLLPAQGPITAFVHHNTLHAFEEMPFEEAVVHGGEVFGCHPYLPEEKYRHELSRGRILPDDIEAALIEDLGDEGEVLLGFLGTRFHLRMAVLAQPFQTGPSEELRWVIAETDALRKFREESPRSIQDRVATDTRHWIMRDLRNGGAVAAGDPRLRELLDRVFPLFDRKGIERWDDSTWEAFTLHALWSICLRGVSENYTAPTGERPLVRHRDLLLEATGQDSDQLVTDLLVRYCGAFLDQGFAEWEEPNREAGFYRAFLDLYSQPLGPCDRWLSGLRRELLRLKEAGASPVDSILESLELLGVRSEEMDSFVSQSLLALRGYAGMIWQLESRGDRAARAAPSGSLVEFLAIRLVLDRLAVRFVAWESVGYRGALSKLRNHLMAQIPHPKAIGVDQRAYQVFQLSQVVGWSPQLLFRLSTQEWSMLLSELASFSSLERRRIYHLAFERRYRIQTLDAVAIHSRRRARTEKESFSQSEEPPAFQIACCIDEREESFRRHLEEIAPECETLGVAGFFAVAMYYRGAADAHYTPLCPVIIQPQHYVAESVVYSMQKDENRRRRRRRTIGTVTRQVHVGSRALAGGWVAGVFGSLASFPLVARILFPRATARLRQVFGGFVRTPAVTQLQLERTETDPGPHDGHIGYSVGEMAAAVERLLRDMGLTRRFSRIVIICGHGSSSLNNPHEAAHDCGACGGGRGGPNARAFAQMANDPRVRQLVAENGLRIPPETVFVGAYHNTCDDSVAYYDLDQLPPTHQAEFEAAKASIDEARARSAHERCRRFESAELRLSAEAALRHVEGRAEDLSQVRPEYGHATNALCFVGRREWSRGLFLDRRAFLQSYEPAQDDADASILTRVLQAVIPVCAGISLEYYFSFVDPTGYGCGTKLPHNIACLVGVMNGAASDLRPGLPWQMVEIHEPVRLLFVIEATPATMLRIMNQNEGIARLVRGGWVQVATLDSETSEIHLFRDGAFRPYRPATDELPTVNSSIDWYRGWRDHLGFASIDEQGKS